VRIALFMRDKCTSERGREEARALFLFLLVAALLRPQLPFARWNQSLRRSPNSNQLC
jgi:hypothetical protein